MSVPASALERLRPGLPQPFATLGLGVALAVGAAAAVSPMAAVAVVVALGVGIAVMLRPASLLAFLVAAVSVEMISVGGVKITRLIAPVALITVLAYASRYGFRLHLASPFFWAWGYSLWALASGLWTVHDGGTTFQLLSLAICLVYMVAFASLLNTRRQLIAVIATLAVASFFIGITSIAAFTGHKFPGIDLTLQQGRAQGGIGDPSFFAAFQLFALPLLLALAIRVEKNWQRAALYLVALVNIGSVLSTVSRGGVLQLVVVSLALLVLPWRMMFRSRRQKAALMAVLALGAGAFLFRYSADIVPRVSTIFTQGSGGRDSTASGRLIIWPAAIDAFQERPVLGIGYGAFVETSVDRMFETRNTSFGSFHVHPEQVHNVYLGALAELGVPGLALFLGLLASTGLTLLRSARRAGALGAEFSQGIASALLVGLVGWCVGAAFISAETSRPPWILIGICLALPKLIAEEASEKGDPAEEAPAPR